MAKIRIKQEFENDTYTGIDFLGGKPLYKVKLKDLSENFISLWYELLVINKGNLNKFEVYESKKQPARNDKKVSELHLDGQGLHTEEGQDNNTETEAEIGTDTE